MSGVASPSSLLTPGSAGTGGGAFGSPGSDFGPIETEKELSQYLAYTESQSAEQSPLGDSPLYLPIPSPYRPSHRFAAQPGAAAAAGGADGSIGDLFSALLEFQTNPDPRRMLDTWTDRLREWLASHVFQPLHVHLAESHLRVNEACTAIPALQSTALIKNTPPLLPSREQQAAAARRHQQQLAATPRKGGLLGGRGGGFASGLGGSGSGGGGGGGGGGDGGGGGGGDGLSSLPGGGGGGMGGALPHSQSYDGGGEALEAEMRTYVEQISAYLLGNRRNLGAEEVAVYERAVTAITRHLALLLLLRGNQPSGLLTGALPPAYTAGRIAALSAGSCLVNFKWDGGGEWPEGRPWNGQELPDDSQLVLYIVSAFLQAPGWTFHAQHAGLSVRNLNGQGGLGGGGLGGLGGGWGLGGGGFMGAGGGGLHSSTGSGVPLFIGALPAPARAPERYACLLLAPYRPPESAPGAFGLSITRAGPPRLHCYGLGRELCCVQGQQGVLHALVLFFLIADKRGGGALGPARLDSTSVALSSIFQWPGSAL